MGFLDKLRGKAAEAAGQHGDKIGDGLEKAKNFVDDKTGGKLGEKGDTAVEKAREAIDKLGEKDDPK